MTPTNFHLRTAATTCVLALTIALPVQALELRSISELEFGEGGTLFIGDSLGAKIAAVETDAASPQAPNAPVFMENVDERLAVTLGAEMGDLVITDMKVDPVSQNIYIAVEIGRSANPTPALVRLLKNTGELERVDLASLAAREIDLPSTPGFEDTLQYGQSERTLTVTDLTFWNGGDDDPATGELFVAGVSNEDFASTLRRVPVPFGSETNVEASSIEIYHAGHDQQETRAPIVTSVVHEIAGEPWLIAAYTCTPLARFRLADLEDGAHVVGETVAELGFGNAPVDMFVFQNPEMMGGGEKLLITNDQRSAVSVSTNVIASAEPLSEKAFGAVGLDQFPLPLTGALQTARLNDQFTVTIRRNVMSGDLNLQSVLNGAFFEVSESIVEFNFPDVPPSEFPSTNPVAYGFGR